MSRQFDSPNRDDGSALIMVLVLMVVGSLIVSGILRFTSAVVRARPHLHEQSAAGEAVKSATRMAITLQRDFGPSACFAASSTTRLNGFDVTTSCETASEYNTSKGRLGVVSTTTSGDPTSVSTPAWAGTPGTSGSTLFNSASFPWSTRVGDEMSTNFWPYPSLPQIPSYERPGSQSSIGTCMLYFPGRYLGSTALTLNGGTHYFASGIYYFERPLIITGGAQVVFGEGLYSGCAVDAQAAYATAAPKSHEITGKGATILLGDIAYVSVQESSVRINRRVSTATTRGSEGVAIRTVNFGQTNATVTVPADQVLLSDGSLTAVSSYSVIPAPNTPAVTYRTSSLAAASAYAIDVRLNGTSTATNRFQADGYVFTPNAGVRVTSTSSQYALIMSSGVVATRLALALSLAPATSSNYSVGVKSTAIQRKVVLRSQVVSAAGATSLTSTSTAIIEVHADKSYAINSWTVDP